MDFLERLFGGRQSRTLTTTVNAPFQIQDPRIGFLNLQGSSGAALVEADRRTLAPLFKESYISSDAVPKCEVLFLYCTIDPAGRVATSRASVRDLIKTAGAYVAIVASENDPDSYIKALGPRNDWHANIVLVIDRKADKFALFFRRLFEAMFKKQSMLMAWVELAPQAPAHAHPDAPGTIMAAEAGHLTFGG